jgi:hypothetical protein
MRIKFSILALVILISFLVISLRNCDDKSIVANEKNQSTISRPATSEKVKLTIAFMLPQDFIRTRNFNVCINREMTKINRGNWSFVKNFYLDRFEKNNSRFYRIILLVFQWDFFVFYPSLSLYFVKLYNYHTQKLQRHNRHSMHTTQYTIKYSHIHKLHWQFANRGLE